MPQADLILALDVPDLEGATVRRAQELGNRKATPLLPADAKVINVALDDLLVRAWATDFNKLRRSGFDDSRRHGGFPAGTLAPA